MRKTLFISLFGFIFLLSSVPRLLGQSGNSKNTDDNFQVTLINSNYSSAYSIRIILTNQKLDIIFKSGLVGGKDSLLFSTPVQQSDTLLRIGSVDIKKLKSYYSNDCVSDGTQITIEIRKNGIAKIIHLSNYYQEDMGTMIYLINSLVPDKYKVGYDRKRLKAYEKLCNGTN